MITGFISGIKRMEIHDGDGLRTTVFFKGCPLSCIWCHNPESISFSPETAFFPSKCVQCGTCSDVCPTHSVHLGTVDKKQCVSCFRCVENCPTEALVGFGKKVTSEELFDLVKPDFPFFSNGRGGVTFSGGECLAQPDFVIESAKLFSNAGISVNIDTCGYVPFPVFERILPYVDTFLYDIKAISPNLHKSLTGRDNSLILDNLLRLSQSGANIEIRYPLVIGYNDCECEDIGRFLAPIKGIKKIKVLPFHRYASSRYESLGKNDTLPPEEAIPKPEDMIRVVRILSDFGLRAVNGFTGD